MPTEAVCPKCEGTGWIIREHAHLSGAEPCDCRLQGRSARLEDRAQIPPLYRNASIDTERGNFILPDDNPIARRALTDALLTVKNYVREFPNETRPGLLLIGEPGTGKTHLAVAAMKKIIEKGFECLFCDYQNLLDRIHAGYDPNSNASDKEAYRMALDSEVLLLDDLGANRGSDWVEDTITTIITYRCNNRKPLIATTNCPDADAGSVIIQRNALNQPERRPRSLGEQIGARARSRLFEMCTVVHMNVTEDYRIRKAQIF